MRIRFLILLLIFSPCLVWEDACCAAWHDLLDRGDSLVATGALDSASVVADHAMSEALSRYGKSDTTIEVCFYREGIPEYRYVHSYAETETLYTRLASLKEKVLGGGHPNVAEILTDLASVYIEQSKYAEAKSLHERALAIREGALDSMHPDIGRSLRGLACTYRGLADYDRAEELYGRSLSILEEALGPEHPDVALSLSGLAIVYGNQGRYAEAEPLHRRALGVREKALGPEHPDVALNLSDLAIIYGNQGRYAEAEPLYRRALAIREKAQGRDHPDIAWALEGLARLKRDQGRYAEAESLFYRALTIRETGLGCRHPLVARSLVFLGILYANQGRYLKAKQSYERALVINEDTYGPGHLQVGVNLHNLAALCWQTGRLLEAERLYLRALPIYEEAYGSEHYRVANCLQDLANVYGYQGKWPQAERLYKRALATLEKSVGPDHDDVALALNNLADVYRCWGKTYEAKLLLRRALAIVEKTRGPEHQDAAFILNTMAGVYLSEGRYTEAEELFVRDLSIREKAFGSEHPNVARSLVDLATVGYIKGDYADAEQKCRRAIDIMAKPSNIGHRDLGYAQYVLADIYTRQGKYAEAEHLYKLSIAERSEQAFAPGPTSVRLNGFSEHHRLREDCRSAIETAAQAFDIISSNLPELSALMSESDALNYSQYLRYCVSNYLTCCLDAGLADADLVRSAADAVLFSKGQVSDNVFDHRRALFEETDSGILAVADSLRLIKFRLSELFVKGPGEDVDTYRGEVDSLNRLASDLEADLSRRSIGFRRRQDHKDIRTARVASLLPENSVLVEYVRYDYQQLEPYEKIPHYMVLVVTEAAEPVIVDLGETGGIDALINEYRDQMLRMASAARTPAVVDEQHYQRLAENLYSRIWGPIEEYVTGKALLLIAPDGALNMVSFAGLVDNQGRYLIERFPVHYLSSGRDLIRLKDKEELGEGLFALGDPDYDAPTAERLPEFATGKDTVPELAYYVTRNVRSGCGDLRDIAVSPLPGTRKEVELIGSRWKESSGEPLIAYLGREASEENFKSEAPGKRVVHLATHGYFLEGACRSYQPSVELRLDIGFVGENPLLLSGLFFAGANLHGDGADSIDAEDGILTAYEVSAMDLSGTEMVVLSACETGLGRVEDGEGVYGLRRAFQVAGARTVISALWPVPDEATADMMSQLYERQDESIPETMRRIQLDKINELRRSKRPDHPFLWAALIAMGDWR